MKPGKSLICSLLSSFFVLAPALADTISLGADYWMPFNGDGKSESGFLVDVAKTVFEAQGHTVEYRVIPWSRALEEAKNGRLTGVIGATREEAADFLLPKEEQGQIQYGFFAKKSDPWRFNGIDSLKKTRLALIQDYSYEDELTEYIQANKSQVIISTGDNALRNNIKLATSLEKVVTYEECSVIAYTSKTMGLSNQLVLAGSIAGPESIYIAFSPKNPKSAEYARLLSEGMTRLRKSGELKKLLTKYGLSDWK